MQCDNYVNERGRATVSVGFIINRPRTVEHVGRHRSVTPVQCICDAASCDTKLPIGGNLRGRLC